MSDSDPHVRIRLLAPLAGHLVGEQLDHDAIGAGWLIAAGLAETTEDDPEPTTATGEQADDQERPDASQRAARAPGATDRRRGGE